MMADQAPEFLRLLVYGDALMPVDGESAYDAALVPEGSHGPDAAAGMPAGTPSFLLIDPYAE